jgi:hypothetical protein
VIAVSRSEVWPAHILRAISGRRELDSTPTAHVPIFVDLGDESALFGFDDFASNLVLGSIRGHLFEFFCNVKYSAPLYYLLKLRRFWRFSCNQGHEVPNGS